MHSETFFHFEDVKVLVEEFRTGNEYKVSEMINFERLEDDEDIKALVEAMKKEKVKEKASFAFTFSLILAVLIYIH